MDLENSAAVTTPPVWSLREHVPRHVPPPIRIASVATAPPPVRPAMDTAAPDRTRARAARLSPQVSDMKGWEVIKDCYDWV